MDLFKPFNRTELHIAGYFLEKVLSFVCFGVSQPWLCTDVTMTMDFTKGICLLFTSLGHTYLRIERKGIKPIMSKTLGGNKSVYTLRRKNSLIALATNKFFGEIMHKS